MRMDDAPVLRFLFLFQNASNFIICDITDYFQHFMKNFKPLLSENLIDGYPWKEKLFGQSTKLINATCIVFYKFME